MKEKKQAVVLIHGIGEQVPMDTLRGFVEAVWVTDKGTRNERAETSEQKMAQVAWSKPDEISGDFELRRITTVENREGKRTDFFEFYWAHLMEGTTLSHVGAWVKVLLMRSPRRVPQQLLGLWIALWMLVLMGLAGLTAKAAGWLPEEGNGIWWMGFVWLLIGGTVVGLFVNVAGDAARYLHVAPANIAIRRRIREAGIELLEKLHKSGKYDRIVLVGHSLGTVVGYDILTHLWPRYNAHTEIDSTPPTRPEAETGDVALERLEEMGREARSRGPLDVDAYQAAQRRYFEELRKRKKKWLVTDFVTMGSPLAHAEVLMASNKEQFVDKKREREFPTCPPQIEGTLRKERFTYWAKQTDESIAQWVPSHAAVFAPTRWTNLYFPCQKTLWGDLIGGPVAPAFGPGVKDVEVHTDMQWGLLTHTLYWSFPANHDKVAAAPSWIAALREALRICEEPASQVSREQELSL